MRHLRTCLVVLIVTLSQSVMAETAVKTVNVWNYKGYKALTPGGFASRSLKGQSSLSLAHRANNPANIRLQPTGWSRALPGLAGTFSPDKRGRRVFRFYSPEHGFVALYKLVHDVHGFGPVGSIRLDYLGYALSNGNGRKQEQLIRGWIRNSDGALSRGSRVSFRNEDRMVMLFRAIARTGAKGKLPFTDEQIRAGVRLGRAYVQGKRTADISFTVTPETRKQANPGVLVAVARPLPRPVHVYHVEPAGDEVRALLPRLQDIPDVTPAERAALLKQFLNPQPENPE